MRLWVVITALAVSWLVLIEGHVIQLDAEQDADLTRRESLQVSKQSVARSSDGDLKNKDEYSIESSEEVNNEIPKIGSKHGIESSEEVNNEIPKIGSKHGIESSEEVNNEIPKIGPKHGIESSEEINNDIPKIGPSHGIESSEEINNDIPKIGPKYGIESSEEINNDIPKIGPKHGIESSEEINNDIPNIVSSHGIESSEEVNNDTPKIGPKFGIDSSEEFTKHDYESSGDHSGEGSGSYHFYDDTEDSDEAESSGDRFWAAHHELTTESPNRPFHQSTSTVHPDTPRYDHWDDSSERFNPTSSSFEAEDSDEDGGDLEFNDGDYDDDMDPNDVAIISSPQWKALMVLTATNAEMKDPAFLAKWVYRREVEEAEEQPIEAPPEML